jgi:hypothetical protein
VISIRRRSTRSAGSRAFLSIVGVRSFHCESMMKFYLEVALLTGALAVLAACADPDAPLASSSRGSGTSGTGGAATGGSGGDGGASTGGTGSSTGGSAGSAGCGGPTNTQCAADEWCDFDHAHPCGAENTTGVCQKRPNDCPFEDAVACGCDGLIYKNSCFATAVGGVDVKDCSGGLSCDELADNIASLTRARATCTSVVRLDARTFTPKGWQIFCGDAKSVDDASARAIAQADTGFGASGQALTGDAPADEFVYWSPPDEASATIGGVAAVSAETGLSVFGASIDTNLQGAIVYPTSWRSPFELGSNCDSMLPLPALGFDLSVGGALDAAQVDDVMTSVRKTALLPGIAKAGVPTSAVVLLWWQSVGIFFDPPVMEWVVLINSAGG